MYTIPFTRPQSAPRVVRPEDILSRYNLSCGEISVKQNARGEWVPYSDDTGCMVATTGPSQGAPASEEGAPTQDSGMGVRIATVGHVSCELDGRYLLPYCGPVVHLKGFAARVNFKDPETRALTKEFIEWVKAVGPGQLVWDGDEWHAHSFTSQIPWIKKEVPAVELVAFVRQSNRDTFEQSWAPSGLEINVYLCDDFFDWQTLGTHALGVTKSKIVGCLGGGDTIEKEYANKPADDVKFTMFAITRPSADGASTEKAALQERAKSNGLEIITL